jgi:hypothetical protein
VQLTVHGFLELFSDAYPTLGKLPSAAPSPAAEKDSTIAAHQDDADVRAEAV